MALALSCCLSPYTSVLSSYSTSDLHLFFARRRAKNEREKERRGRDEPMSGVRASVGPSPQSTLMGTWDWVDPGYAKLRASESQRGCVYTPVLLDRARGGGKGESRSPISSTVVRGTDQVHPSHTQYHTHAILDIAIKPRHQKRPELGDDSTRLKEYEKSLVTTRQTKRKPRACITHVHSRVYLVAPSPRRNGT